jgi:hypothetical protein
MVFLPCKIQLLKEKMRTLIERVLLETYIVCLSPTTWSGTLSNCRALRSR